MVQALEREVPGRWAVHWCTKQRGGKKTERTAWSGNGGVVLGCEEAVIELPNRLRKKAYVRPEEKKKAEAPEVGDAVRFILTHMGRRGGTRGLVRRGESGVRVNLNTGSAHIGSVTGLGYRGSKTVIMLGITSGFCRG